MLERMALHTRIVSLAVCVCLFSMGCEGQESTVPTETPAEVAESTVKAIEAPATESAAAETPVVSQEPSPEEQAAREAFRAMTAEGVSPEEVDAATEKLQELGTAALPVLAEGLKSEESIHREMAATMLALIGSGASSVSDALIAALGDKSDFVRANAATALAQMEGQASHVIPVFGDFLQSEDANLRMMAVMNLGVLDPADAKPLINQLIATLDSDDPTILRPVVELLGKMGPDASDALVAIKALDTTDDDELETTVNAAVMQIEAGAE